MLVAASVAYSKFGLCWGTFALFFLTPDVSFLGYLAGSRVGAVSYNLAHSYIGAVACLVTGLPVPDHTQMWRRAIQLPVTIPRKEWQEPIHLVVDRRD
ncbi:MAG: DUF4260 family protein [Methylococcaceae bacterium]|nr:DUF4260 family protein [Methylococcaceae bacterium]